MAQRKSRLDVHVEKTENLVQYLLKKKKQNIQNSLARPLYQEAFRSLFFVCILLIDAFLPLEVYRALPFPFNVIASLGFLGAFLYIERVIYNLLWGKKGRWSLEKYTNHPKEDVKQKKEP
jgi:hypothetical protein